MKKNLLKIGALVCGLSVGGFSTANAIPMMTLNDGAGNTVALDGLGTLILTGNATGAGSVVPLGTVLFSGSIGAWSLTVELGITKPFQGSAAVPSMDLNFSATTTSTVGNPSGVGNLTIMWSDTGFGPSTGGFVAAIGGTLGAVGGAGGSVAFSTFYSAANSVPAGTALTAALGFSTPGSFSGTANASVGPLDPPYSLTEQLVIHNSGAQTTSGDATLVGVPGVADGGSTLALLGGVLILMTSVYRFERVAVRKNRSLASVQ